MERNIGNRIEMIVGTEIGEPCLDEWEALLIYVFIFTFTYPISVIYKSLPRQYDNRKEHRKWDRDERKNRDRRALPG